MIGGGVRSRGARVRMTKGGAGAACGSRTSLMINGPGEGGVGGRTERREKRTEREKRFSASQESPSVRYRTMTCCLYVGISTGICFRMMIGFGS